MKSKILKICLNLIFPIITSVVLFQTYINPQDEVKSTNKTRPNYMIYDGTPNLFIVRVVDTVLSRLNLNKINISGMTPENVSVNSWDLFWSFKAITNYNINWSSLNPYQKVNHIPGNHVLVSKSILATKTNSKYIPKGFLKAQDVQEYAKNHPDKKFVLKLKSNRGVKLAKASEMNFTITASLDEYFAQEFVENPLLWNGHKFDFAMYVVITSVNPLRLYYYNQNVYLRFTPKPYDISDPSDVKSYVIDSEHIPGHHFGPVKKYTDNFYTCRDAFDEFMSKKVANLDEIYEKIEDLIRSVVTSKEKDFIYWISDFKANKLNFFEMYRFDMIFNENLDLYLLEINQSPGLSIHGDQFAPYRPVFYSLLYNLFQLVDVGSSYERETFRFPHFTNEEMVTPRLFLSVNPEECLTEKCTKVCEDECSLCNHCSKGWNYQKLRAYQEQLNAGGFKRIFPPDEKFLKNVNESFWSNLSPANTFMTKWYQGMCRRNNKFCS